MIAHLRGKVIFAGEKEIVVEVNGVGYALAVSAHTRERIGIDENVSLHVYTYVREQALELYGFTDREEKELFTLLISVSGIGPKAALGILSAAAPATLRESIVCEDVSLLTQVPGVGKKTAQRVVLELKNKVGEYSTTSSQTPLASNREVLEALCGMGYSVAEARQAVNAVDENISDLSEKLRAALKILAK